jgi:hypothetical protein
MDKAASVAIMPDYEIFCADLREGMIEVFPMLLNNRPLISAMSEVLSSTELITTYYYNVVLRSTELITTHYYHVLKGSIK